MSVNVYLTKNRIFCKLVSYSDRFLPWGNLVSAHSSRLAVVGFKEVLWAWCATSDCPTTLMMATIAPNAVFLFFVFGPNTVVNCDEGVRSLQVGSLAVYTAVNKSRCKQSIPAFCLFQKNPKQQTRKGTTKFTRWSNMLPLFACQSYLSVLRCLHLFYKPLFEAAHHQFSCASRCAGIAM